ncbi:transposase [Streptomyces griseomycini]|nr:transposase [Streptomyces griseomycini]
MERPVPDGVRESFRRVAPAARLRPQGGGRRRCGDRQVPAGIVLAAATGCARRPPLTGFRPPGATAHRRFTGWGRARARGGLHRLVPDGLGARGGVDRSRCAIGPANMRAVKGGT